MKKPITILPALLLGLLCAAALQAAPLELKFGHVGEPGSLFEVSANEFARLANAKLGDRATVTAFGSSQLGKD